MLPVASSDTNENFTVNNEDPVMITGDYFLYDLDMSIMIEGMESDEDVVEVLVNSNSGMRMEYGGESCLQTGWEDCSIGLMYWNLNITIVYDESMGVDNDRAIMEMRTESTIVMSGLHSEDTTIREMEMWFSMDGENYHSESILAIDYINKNTPDDSKILFWPNNGFYLERDYIYALGFIVTMADSKKIYNRKTVVNELKRFGITHVAMTDNYLRRKLKNTLLPCEGINIIYNDRNMIVAKVE